MSQPLEPCRCPICLALLALAASAERNRRAAKGRLASVQGGGAKGRAA